MGCGDQFTEGRSEMDWIKFIYEQSRKFGAQMGVKLPSFENFWKKGYFLYDVRPQERDYVAFANFRKDPKRNSLGTESGLIQIYSPKIASYGYKSCLGHPSYLEPTEGLNTPNKKYPLAYMACKSRYRMHSQLDGTSSHDFANILKREPIWINPGVTHVMKTTMKKSPRLDADIFISFVASQCRKKGTRLGAQVI